MERIDSPKVIEAVGIGLTRHLRHGSQYEHEAAAAFLDFLQERGLAVVERQGTILEWSPWRLQQVVPGRVSVAQIDDEHVVTAEAIATLVRTPPLGRGPIVERDISAATVLPAGEDDVGETTKHALVLAMSQARAAADGFIAASEEQQ